MLCKIADISLIRKYGMYGKEKFNKYQLYPFLYFDCTLEDTIKDKGNTISDLHKKFFLCYIWNGEEPIAIKGRFTSLFDTWGIFTQVPMNFLEYNDFVNYFDHDELMSEDSIGIIYSTNKTIL